MPYRRTESRIRHSESMKKSLLAAAVSILSEEGFTALTVRKTIEVAGTSNGNFYFYFRDKDDLVDQVIRGELEEIGQIIDHAGRVTGQDVATIYSVLATMVYTGVRLGLRHCEKPGILFQPDLRSRTYSGLKPFMINRTRRVLADALPLPIGLSPPLAATLWQGSLLTVIEEFGDKKADHCEIARQSAAWNLRAIGAPDHETESAVTVAERTWETVAASLSSDVIL